MKTPRSVLVIVNREKEGAHNLSLEIQDFFVSQEIAVRVLEIPGTGIPGQDLSQHDLAVVLGGDGTVLTSASLLVNTGIPILAVNLGRVGFITEVSRTEWQGVFERYCEGRLRISHRMMLDIQVIRDGQSLTRFFALNDGVVSSSGSSKIVHLELNLSQTFLGEYRADGLIVATPTGSTAYSLAAGGPVLSPELEVIVVTPVCPHSLSNRPLVVPGKELITIDIGKKQRTDVVLTVDGRDIYPLLPGDRVRLSAHEVKIPLIQSDTRSFYEVVREKLN